ncbi:hypothetical protein LR48_Vigan05g079300 [Vigna angularis]|uniref:Uncharacterized protein n=1 Tax=Phaseolus angularis TaxID=3914 RepID=A0A0L9UKV0_PHAAN|nr:hypothetical protein LR48_Vigan05g079300 [Vigna angularis]
MPFLCILRLNPTFPSFSSLLRRERNQPQVKFVIVGTQQPASEPAVVMLPSLKGVAPAPISHICCLVNSIWMVRFGELKGVGAMIEQVKGFSYSVFYLHGASPFLPTVDGDVQEKHNESITTT